MRRTAGPSPSRGQETAPLPQTGQALVTSKPALPKRKPTVWPPGLCRDHKSGEAARWCGRPRNGPRPGPAGRPGGWPAEPARHSVATRCRGGLGGTTGHPRSLSPMATGSAAALRGRGASASANGVVQRPHPTRWSPGSESWRRALARNHHHVQRPGVCRHGALYRCERSLQRTHGVGHLGNEQAARSATPWHW